MKFTKKLPPNGINNNRHSLSSASDIAADIMYPPIQPKIPPVRPRSSLSTDEHHRFRNEQIHRQKRSNTIFTLIGFCVFLLVLVAFLLGALVYVGRTIAATGNMSNMTFPYELSDEQKQNGNHFLLSDEKYSIDSVINQQKTKPILLFPTSKLDKNSLESNYKRMTTMPKLNANILSTSKVLNQLGYRLPKEIRPKHYNLFLNPNLQEKTFSGNITIKLEILKPISFIPVHANKLAVETLEVLALSTGEEAPRQINPSLTFQHPELEYWVTEFADPLTEGNYSLKLNFNGSLTDRIVGLYQSSYKDKATNETRWMATSKFEPTYARQAFPCFDEPAMKAFFEVTLVHPTAGGYHALSNMNEVKQTVKGNVTEVVFADSVQMSTYLACFIVSDFHHRMKKINATVGSDFDMRVFATAAQMEKATYALNTGATIIEHYISYFNLAYPLPKLDMAAIPDFVSGAMEHWGLVTFRETALLYDENSSSSANKQRVATVIAHELAHMWFGNLVTMKWWNDLWLNEGFASYIEYKGVNSVHPDWKMLDQFLTDDLHGVMKLDATLASHPIVQTVESPNQITELFDSITYSKGASIIRMLEGFVGEDVFKEAVHNYLDRYQFSNAETDDFFSEFESFSLDFDVKLIMKTWTVQTGYPVVDVVKVNQTQYKLTQKRFFSNPEDYNQTHSDSEFNYRWTIPITYTTSANPVVQKTWFNYDDSEVIINLPSATDWIKINKDQVGYYRVNYPQEIWEQINKALFNTPAAFSISDRAHLLNDAFTLADSTQLSYKTALDLTKFLQNELEYVPWNVATSKLLSMKNLLYYTDVFNDFRKYARRLLIQVYENVGWEVDENNHLKNLLRVTILDAACSFGHVNCLQEVGARFTSWLSDPSNRPKPDLRNAIYFHGMAQAGTEETWDQMWDLFKYETDASEKAKLMQGLSAIKEPWILQRFIELAWDESNVRGQDYFTCLQNIARNPVGQSLVWDYVRENWEKLVERFGINERYLGRLIPAITGRFTTNQKLEEMEIFFAKYPEAGAGTAARKEALENVKYNINWLKANKNQIAEWLANQ
ncbi:glutamyl aminopeptidase-like isoform X1 [Episyrphus balteatus]|uniref:glutamyl aminopeptidase-like isoform X1 n=1 Tax=Episyrphus balteatus TaxID=286459 RepID=UPI0024860D68|nr:glutamyl aminopeptidase-like isoform X1 [Episyrphus balteatus]XP_055851689.1 glutamyl aminopeptidase-like isoform X1 [Episyrphus balteatus]XP_055851691.1 glutamyl aminopeptidase-like isoform X1 [Episyrphus balteatus]